jgi:hypothetical protein
MKDFQHFPKRLLWFTKSGVFAGESAGVFLLISHFPVRKQPGKDNSRKRTGEFPQVPLAYSVHLGEKIAHKNQQRRERKFFGR